MSKNGKAKRRIFSAEYKAEVVRLCAQPGKGPYSVARDLGLTPSAVAGWVRQAKVDASGGGNGTLTTAGREELANPKPYAQSVRRNFPAKSDNLRNFDCLTAQSQARQ